MPNSSWMRRNSSCIALRSLRSSAASGSSSRKRLRLPNQARASATRWAWPPGSCRGGAILDAGQAHKIEHASHGLTLLLERHAAEGQWEGNVGEDALVRKKGVPLEDGVDRPSVRRQPVDPPAMDGNAAGVWPLEAADDAQQRGLAAAAGAEQGDESPLLDPQRDIVEGGRSAEALGDPGDDDGGVVGVGCGAD